MTFQLIAVCALLFSVANAGLISGPLTYAANPVVTKVIAQPSVDTIASTHQNVVRSFSGTVSQFSKAVVSPYSSVRKEDTRISNNVYTPAIAKTITYSAPTPIVPAAAVYTQASPIVSKTVYSTPPTAAIYTHHQAAVSNVGNLYTHAAPVKTVTYNAPAHTSHAAHVENVAPVYQHHHETPTTTVYSQPAASSFTHNAPEVSAYGTSQTIHYSPAELVSHMSFDGFGTHYGF